ncbi:hypothetical protein ACJX0J_022466, partial [Zea mays]
LVTPETNYRMINIGHQFHILQLRCCRVYYEDIVGSREHREQTLFGSLLHQSILKKSPPEGSNHHNLLNIEIKRPILLFHSRWLIHYDFYSGRNIKKLRKHMHISSNAIFISIL